MELTVTILKTVGRHRAMKKYEYSITGLSATAAKRCFFQLTDVNVIPADNIKLTEVYAQYILRPHPPNLFKTRLFTSHQQSEHDDMEKE